MEVNLTYEVLFELVMREKSREELQKLPADFEDSSVGYIQKKRQMAQELPELQAEAAERQANNAIRLLKELYERREKKLVNIALLKARADDAVIDYAAMLGSERQFFEALLALMRSHRELTFTSRMEKLRQQRRIVVTNGGQAEAQVEESAAPAEPIATKLVRFLNPVPKFVGKELEVYGPFEEEEMANLPVEIADVLIKKGRAEEVSG